MLKVLEKYDYKRTKEEVEEYLEDYIELRLKLNNIPYYSSMQFKFVYTDCNTNSDVVSSIGDYEMQKQELELKKYLKIVNAYEKLFDDDKIIIGNLYFKDKKIGTNEEIRYDLGLGRDSFLYAKKEAIVNFGIALGVAVQKRKRV